MQETIKLFYIENVSLKYMKKKKRFVSSLFLLFEKFFKALKKYDLELIFLIFLILIFSEKKLVGIPSQQHGSVDLCLYNL